MKKRNNKTIILIIIGLFFITFLGIFILNYSKDDASFSLLEKKWINDNASKVIDISVYNDVPIFGKNGTGVIFDLLDDFTDKYKISFNKVPYLMKNNNSLKPVSFKILDGSINLSDKDILIYEDNYVLVSSEEKSIDRISDIKNIELAILTSDIGLISGHLADSENVRYLAKNTIGDIETSIKNNEVQYALVPYNMNIDFILRNNLNILYHLSDLSKKYTLTIEDNTFLNIMKKYYKGFSNENQSSFYKEHFLEEYFFSKNIAEADRMGYNATPYTFGYTNYMPFTNKEDKNLVGTLSNYLAGFEDAYDVDFKFVYYDNIEALKKDLSGGVIDAAFANFNNDGLNIDIKYTPSIFKEEYVVLSEKPFVINSIKGLKDKKVNILKNSYINDLIVNNNILCNTYDSTDDLIRSASSDTILILDKATYEYYGAKRLSEYKNLYTGILPNEYRFMVRDVNKNTLFADMFAFYVSTVNYEDVRFQYNTNSKLYDYSLLVTFLITILTILLILLLVFIIKKKKKNSIIITTNEKIKYIDAMTSLKNRSYLNVKIKEWDENPIYPQAFVIIDLNNIKYINDNHGHEEGDMVIKKAASTLIVNQIPNTDIVRTDGTEFLIYMINYSEKDVVAYTRKIYKDLKELPYNFGATIGYSMIMDDVKTVDDAINEAIIDMKNKKELN